MSAIEVEVISDVVCPWCFIGTRRLEQVLKGRDAHVKFAPFLLDSRIPLEGVDLREHLAKKFGGDPARMFSRVEDAAKEAGIALDFSKVRRYPSTVRAHTLIRHAESKGTQRAIANALFEAYFLEGRDIANLDVLSAIAVAHGFDAAEAARIMADEVELKTTRDQAAAQSAQGVSGVPFFIFGERLAFSGAQPVTVFERAIAESAQ